MSDQFVHLHSIPITRFLTRLRRRKARPSRERARDAGRGHEPTTAIFLAPAFRQCGPQRRLKPIVGCELYVCKKDDHNIERTRPRAILQPPAGSRENEEGYRNLVKITSEASLHGFYYKPRVSKKFLAEHSRD